MRWVTLTRPFATHPRQAMRRGENEKLQLRLLVEGATVEHACEDASDRDPATYGPAARPAGPARTVCCSEQGALQYLRGWRGLHPLRPRGDGAGGRAVATRAGSAMGTVETEQVWEGL